MFSELRKSPLTWIQLVRAMRINQHLSTFAVRDWALWFKYRTFIEIVPEFERPVFESCKQYNSGVCLYESSKYDWNVCKDLIHFEITNSSTELFNWQFSILFQIELRSFTALGKEMNDEISTLSIRNCLKSKLDSVYSSFWRTPGCQKHDFDSEKAVKSLFQWNCSTS